VRSARLEEYPFRRALKPGSMRFVTIIPQSDIFNFSDISNFIEFAVTFHRARMLLIGNF